MRLSFYYNVINILSEEQMVKTSGDAQSTSATSPALYTYQQTESSRAVMVWQLFLDVLAMSPLPPYATRRDVSNDSRQ